jgi:hypothetical protein
MKHFFLNGAQTWKDDFSAIKALFKAKDFLFLSILLLSFLYTVLMAAFSRNPWNYVYNPLFICLFIVVLIFAFYRKTIKIDVFSVFFFLYAVITFVIDATKGIFKTTPLANAFLALCFYELIQAANQQERRLLLRTITIGLSSLLVGVIVRYTGPLLATRSFRSFDDNYFGNLDGMSNLLCILMVFCLYYFRKGDFVGLLVAILSGLYAALSARRTAFIILIVAIFGFVYALLHEKKKAYFYIVSFAMAALLIILLNLPAFASLKTRIIDTLNGAGSNSTDFAVEERTYMVLRGFFDAFTNLFKSYGFEGFSKFLATGSHESLGDQAFAYGGLFSLVLNAVLLAWSVPLIRTKGEFHYLCAMCGCFIIIIFLLGSIMNTRSYCFFIGVCLGYLTGEREDNCKEETLGRSTAQDVLVYESK